MPLPAWALEQDVQPHPGGLDRAGRIDVRAGSATAQVELRIVTTASFRTLAPGDGTFDSLLSVDRLFLVCARHGGAASAMGWKVSSYDGAAGCVLCALAEDEAAAWTVEDALPGVLGVVTG
jgi:hypothetical protein